MNKIYRCEECGYGYEIKELVEKCKAYCKTHNSCSLEITKLAISPPND